MNCRRDGQAGRAVKLLQEYLDRATQFEKLAAEEGDPKVKDQLLEQAKAYRKLAAKRCQMYGLPMPSPPETHE